MTIEGFYYILIYISITSPFVQICPKYQTEELICFYIDFKPEVNYDGLIEPKRKK